MKRVFTSLALIFGLFVFTAGAALAQEMMTPTDLANAEPGQCYAQVYTPAKYTTQTKRVLKNEASFRLETVPAVYEAVTERVHTKANCVMASTMFPADPAGLENTAMTRARPWARSRGR